jgi:peptide/nickel transport system ATP-binding protein
VLTIRDLSVTYRDGVVAIQALDRVDLELKAGQILALVGETGSGKTTLGKAVMGLLPKNAGQAGSIKLGDQELIGLDERLLNHLRWSTMAMVFQNGAENLNPVHRVIDQIAEPLIHTLEMRPKEARRRAESLLLSLGLQLDEALRYPHELSGGQIQRALLAMALVLDPAILILDEPTASLDPMTKSFIARVIVELRDRGKAILLITHDLDLVHSIADGVAVLYLGQIMERLPGRDLLSFPLHPYTVGLARSYPTLETTRDLGGIRGDAFFRTLESGSSESPEVKMLQTASARSPGKPYELQKGCLFRPRCTQGIDPCGHEAIALRTVGQHEVRCWRGGIVQMLELQEVSKTYGDVVALHPTDLQIQAGEVFCLVGETGSGKTTLAMIAAGFLKPEQGRRLFDGKDMDQWIERDYASLARQVGVIYQNPAESVSHRFTVFDIVAEPLRIHGAVREKMEIKDRVLRTLSDVHLPTDDLFLKRYPHELNMGAIQRLCLARALVLDPILLVADEPTSALDPSVQAKVLRRLLDLQIERGLTLLFVTHNIGLARKIADRIGVMLAGHLLEIGPAHRVLAHPLHPYTRFLLQRIPDEARRTKEDTRRASKTGCPFASRCEQAATICFEDYPQGIAQDGFSHTARCHFPLRATSGGHTQTITTEERRGHEFSRDRF